MRYLLLAALAATSSVNAGGLSCTGNYYGPGASLDKSPMVVTVDWKTLEVTIPSSTGWAKGVLTKTPQQYNGVLRSAKGGEYFFLLDRYSGSVAVSREAGKQFEYIGTCVPAEPKF